MVQNQADNRPKQNNNVDNLKKLAGVFNANTINILLSEVRKAKEKLENFNEKVRSKIRAIRPDALDDNNSFNKNESFSSQKTFSHTGKPNFQPRSQNGGFNKPFNKFDKNGKPFPPRQNAGFNKPFNPNGKPNFRKVIEPQIDLNSLAKEQNRNFGNKKKTHEMPNEHKQMNKKAQMRFMVSGDEDDEDKLARRYKARRKEEVKVEQQIKQIDHAVITSENMTVKDFSEKIGKPVAEIVKKLFILGIMATINSKLDYDTAELVASDFGITLEKNIEQTQEQIFEQNLQAFEQDNEKDLVKRPPVVTVMGHVDHGKTSLLDAIRKTNVVSGEAGGITQSIGAYTVKINGESITFVDTPGHEAFTAMRARGASITDIAILVVAADDGVMPQTIEAIHHIKAAKVPMIVAINKMDKPEANPDRVKQELADNDVLPEEWGGDTICVPIAAKKSEGIEKLLEMVLLVAEMQNLRANPSRSAIGSVIEAKLDKGKGPVATILVQNGTLKIGDTVVSGTAFGRIRAMFDENGNSIRKALPSTPVSILGLDAVPSAGDKVVAVDEKQSRLLIEERKNKIKQDMAMQSSAVSLEEFMNKAKEGNLKNLNVIIKADVQGSCEALKQSVLKIKNDEVKISVVHSAVGSVNESDVVLAQASKALIVAFNTKVDAKAKNIAEHEKIEIREYNVIYNCIEDLESAIHGMMAPKYQEIIIGHAEIRVIFKLSTSGVVAGSYVQDGKIARNAFARVIRDGKTIVETKILSVRIQKDEVKEATKTFECGIKLENFDDIKENDIIEAYTKERIN